MKNFLVLFVFIGLMSCKGVDQFSESINALSTSWDASTAAVTDFSKMLETESTSYASMMGEMKVDSVAFGKLKAEDQTMITDASTACMSAGAGYGAIASELAAFVADWTTKGEMVNELKAGLEAKTLDAEATTKIADLTTYASEALTKVEGWKASLDSVKAACGESHTNYMAMLEKFMPAK